MRQRGVHHLDSHARLQGHSRPHSHAGIVTSLLQLEFDLLEIFAHRLLRQEDAGCRFESDPKHQGHTGGHAAEEPPVVFALLSRPGDGVVVLTAPTADHLPTRAQLARLHGVESPQHSHETQLETVV